MKTPHNTFKQAMAEGRTQVGLWAALANAYSTELLAGIGYDWLLIDGEHAPNDVRSVLAQLQAVASAQHALGDARSHPVVRVPLGTGEAGTAILKQYLDIGAQTVLVPMVDTPEQAAQVAAACRYAPVGVRGMGSALARAARWQTHAQYVHEANDQVCVLVQAETVTAMEHRTPSPPRPAWMACSSALPTSAHRWATPATPRTPRCRPSSNKALPAS